MSIESCKNGHIYDTDRNKSCPFCNVQKKLKKLKKLEPLDEKWYFDSLIGQGAYSEVYKLKNKDSTEFIAAKVLEFNLNDPSAEIRYKNCKKELSFLKMLNNCENIVQAHGYVEYKDPLSGNTYLIILLELLIPLDTYLCEYEINEEKIIKLGKDLCNALIFCQNYNIVHRDIKPENIFVTADETFKLGDFDTAETHADANKTRTIKGTYLYMAPEVFCHGKYDFSCDIYSLGLVFYKIMNENKLPNRKISLKLTENQSELDSPINASIEFSKIILKAASYNSDNRYKDAKDLLQDLSEITNASTTLLYFSRNSMTYHTAIEKTIAKPIIKTVTEKSTSTNKTKKEITVNLVYRLANWIGFSCIFSFIPLFAFLICRHILSKDLSISEKCTSEFLFFALSIAIITIREMSLKKLWDKDKIIFILIFMLVLLILVFSTLLFGVMTLCDMKILLIPDTNTLLFKYSIVLSIFSFLAGTSVQIWEEIDI